MAYAYILLTSKKVVIITENWAALQSTNFFAQVMNICIVFNSFSVITMRTKGTSFYFGQ